MGRCVFFSKYETKGRRKHNKNVLISLKNKKQKVFTCWRDNKVKSQIRMDEPKPRATTVSTRRGKSNNHQLYHWEITLKFLCFFHLLLLSCGVTRAHNILRLDNVRQAKIYLAPCGQSARNGCLQRAGSGKRSELFGRLCHSFQL